MYRLLQVYVCVNVRAIVKVMCLNVYALEECVVKEERRGDGGQESMDRFRDLGSIVNRHSCVKSSK